MLSILNAGEAKAINTFIVCPALIFGIGDGPGSKTSMYYKYVIDSVLTQKYGYIIGEGTNVIGAVIFDFLSHILSDVLTQP